MEVAKNSGFIFNINKIDPIKNISKEKMEHGAKGEYWILAVHCRRDTAQKVVDLPNMCQKQSAEVLCNICKISQETPIFDKVADLMPFS